MDIIPIRLQVIAPMSPILKFNGLISCIASIFNYSLSRLRHTLLPRAFYCLGTLCIVTFCSKEQFPSNWLVTVCFLTHFASQELNTLCSPTHFAKSQFTPQHPLHCYLLLKRTVCFKLACYSLLLNTLYPSAHFAYWNIFLLGTLCSPTPFAS